jgi:putative ABC transport system permease protein
VGDSIRGDLIEELLASGNRRRDRLRYATRALSISLTYVRRRTGSTPREHPPLRRDAMDTIRQDLKFAARSLVARPSFAIMVIATLALGIGAATAIFSVVDAILLRPLPFAQPERLVVFNETTPGGRMSIAWPNYVDVRGHIGSFESVAASQWAAFTLLEGDRARRVYGRLVTAGFLEVLGVKPQLGRTFTANDDRPGAEPVAMVGHRFWIEELGGDANAIGRTLRASERTFTVIGVLPPEFQYADREDILAPLEPTTVPGSILADRGNRDGLWGIGRLKPGVRREQAQAELDRLVADLVRAYPAQNTGIGAEVQLLRDRAVERVQPTLLALMGAVGFLLLLACVNVANLLVARGAARQHELAIRTALGGSRSRLVRHLLVESSLLSIVGASLGVGLAVWLVRTLVALAPPEIPRLDQIGVNMTSLLFALAASITSGLLFGAFPALQTAGLRGEHLLARAGRTSASVSPRRTRRLLTGVEVALALVLLSGCGLMIRTMAQLAAVDPGFRVDHLLTARIMLAGESWNALDRRYAFFDRVVEEVRRVPGVTDAALTLSLPIAGSNWGSVFIVSGKPVPPRTELASAAFIPVSQGYFRTMGIALRRGRAFDSRDGSAAARVVVVNEALARRMWPGEDPIGKRVKQGFPEDENPWREVVGVAADVKLEGVDRDTPLQVFMPLPQSGVRNLAIVARTVVDPGSVGAAVEAAVQAVRPDVPVARILPMTALMKSAVAMRRLSTMILAAFGAVAILIAAVGLYGVVSHNVTERTREIGVRMALGAGSSRILYLFIRQGLTVAVIGTLVGLAGALGLSRWLRTLLFGVEPTDPTTLAAAGILLLIVAAVACYVPARRATQVDPLVALKAE